MHWAVGATWHLYHCAGHRGNRLQAPLEQDVSGDAGFRHLHFPHVQRYVHVLGARTRLQRHEPRRVGATHSSTVAHLQCATVGHVVCAGSAREASQYRVLAFDGTRAARGVLFAGPLGPQREQRGCERECDRCERDATNGSSIKAVSAACSGCTLGVDAGCDVNRPQYAFCGLRWEDGRRRTDGRAVRWGRGFERQRPPRVRGQRPRRKLLHNWTMSRCLITPQQATLKYLSYRNCR